MKKKKWKVDSKRFICFLDIMGFKDMVYTNDHKVVKKKLLDLSQFKEEIMKISKSFQHGDDKYPQFKDCEIRSISFSDSIIFLTNEDKPHDFQILSYAIRAIQMAATQLGIPIKGAFSYGLMTADFNKSIFFGKPLINSYLLQEELQYYGVVLDNFSETFFNKHKETYNDSNIYFTLKTPLKKGSVLHSNLSLLDSRLNQKHLESLYNTVSGSTRIYVDNTIQVFELMNKMLKAK